MKKLVLVIFIGIVLAMDLYGIVNDIMNDKMEVDHIKETTVTVYME